MIVVGRQAEPSGASELNNTDVVDPDNVSLRIDEEIPNELMLPDGTVRIVYNNVVTKVTREVAL